MKNIFIVFIVFVLGLSLVNITPVLADGKPDNCHDTAYQAHPGYNENKELWDGYMADTDDVCQTYYGEGVPSIPCAHTVQVSVQGNPYYLCWYNNVESAAPQGQKSFIEQLIEMIQSFFAKLFGNIPSDPSTPVISNFTTETVLTQIGPYPGKWACDFYQIPWPSVNKKHVSCPYETPGAAINDAANAFCRTVMSSSWAEAEICDQNGVIVCTHPCETTPSHNIPQRCAFDNDRPRGNQAPPMSWCPPTEETPPPASGEGRPDNCDNTVYQAHPGYNENKELWDGYMADSDGVCQTRYGTGVPSSPCAYVVQVSIQGNPYYLCWYNN